MFGTRVKLMISKRKHYHFHKKLNHSNVSINRKTQIKTLVSSEKLKLTSGLCIMYNYMFYMLMLQVWPSALDSEMRELFFLYM